MLADIREGLWLRYKIRMVLSVIVLFFISLAMSCQELRYLVSGKTVDATLVEDRIEQTRTTDGTMVRKRAVWYAFHDKDSLRREYAEVPLDSPRVEGATVKVQYIAGHDFQSRLAGQHHWGWMAVFFASLALAGAGVFLIAREK